MITNEQNKVIDSFSKSMIKELENNAYKGDFLMYAVKKNQEDILIELQYHLDKLKDAVNNNEPENIKEFSADLSNISMFMFNSEYTKK